MEKHAKRAREKSFRLLVLFFLIGIFSSEAESVSWFYIFSLRFKPLDDSIFTQEDSPFYVEIEDVLPDRIQLSVNTLPQDVSFVSSKKESVLLQKEDGSFSNGTRITVWMRFSKSGFYRINPIDVVIDKNFYQLQFEPVEVFENPKSVQPEVSVSFNGMKNFIDGEKIKVKKAQHIVFSVSIRYASSIQDVFWNIPEDSIFKKIQSFPYSSSLFSKDFHQIAVFDWQPLKEGEASLPEVFVTAVSYNGEVSDIKLPSFSFEVSKAEKLSEKKDEENPFAFSFLEVPVFESDSLTSDILEKEVRKIFDLRIKERKSFPILSKAKEERKKAEENIGLFKTDSEMSVFLFYIVLFLAFIFLFFFIFSLIFKRKKFLSFSFIFFVLFSLSSIIYGIPLFSFRGVFAGGKVSPVPEKSVSSSVTIQAGSVVSVIRCVGGWTYIRCKEREGWVLSDAVYIIK